jgi:hypothetical protein
MVPDIKDLLPDVDSTILSGVLEIIVEVSHQLFYAYLSSLLCPLLRRQSNIFVSRIWVMRLVVWVLAWLSCRHQILWTRCTGASWRAMGNSMAGRSVLFLVDSE